METHVPVLIVGGGLSGLTAASLLAHHGVRCILVERHAHTSIQYKFAGISPRSMEIFRGLGLEAEIRARRTGDQQAGAIVRGRTLSDPALQWGGPAWPDTSDVSPTPPATCDQHVLEPILRDCAQRGGADVRFHTECLDLEQDESNVRARIRDRTTGAESTVVADYCIAADGAKGAICERLAIQRVGAGALQHWMNIIFDTDMPATIDGRRFTSCFVTELNGTFTPREGGRWLLALQYFPERGERPEDFDAHRCRALVARGAGRADLKADLVDARPWEVAALVAETFQRGRVFIIGDAAHVMPPPGAFGGNSGIHDAHNLAWKLAMVLHGAAGSGLLDTYDAERRPVIEATAAQALARLQQWFKDPAGRLPPAVPIVDDYDVVFGQRYETAARATERPGEASAFAHFRALAAQPGTRAPHVWIERAGERISTLDLFDRTFVLLARDPSWRDAAQSVGEHSRIALPCYCFGEGGDLVDVEGRLNSVYGIGAGAVLVRPDGFVAWRSDGRAESHESALYDALVPYRPSSAASLASGSLVRRAGIRSHRRASLARARARPARRRGSNSMVAHFSTSSFTAAIKEPRWAAQRLSCFGASRSPSIPRSATSRTAVRPTRHIRSTSSRWCRARSR